jgi:PAS domain-containing protein
MLCRPINLICLWADNTSVFLLTKFDAILQSWLDHVRHYSDTEYAQTIEAMIGDTQERRFRWQRYNYSAIRQVILLIPRVFALLIDTVRLKKDYLLEAISLLAYSSEEVLWLIEEFGHTSIEVRNAELAAMIFRSLHSVTGGIGHQVHWAEVFLLPDGCIKSWNETAQATFGFLASDAIGKKADRIHINPTQHQPHSEFLMDLCCRPEQYFLNVTENRTVQGGACYCFWINFPVYNEQSGRLTEIQSYGIPLKAPEMIQILLQLWGCFLQAFFKNAQ